MMAKVYDIDAYRPAGPKQAEPITRNQELLAQINAMWAARTPKQILMAEINGIEEELQGVQRRYARAVEAMQRILAPSEIVGDNNPAALEPDNGGGSAREDERGRGQ
jgi:hypothetical protein